MPSIHYMDFVFRTESGLFCKEEFLIAANFTVVQKRRRVCGDNQSFTDYLVRVEYIDTRPTQEAWISDLKEINFWDFEVNDVLTTAKQRKMILFKLLYEAERVETHTYYDNISGLCKVGENLLYVQGQYVFPKTIVESEKVEFIPSYRLANYESNFDISEWKAYFNLLPGVSEILFFDALYGVVKPFISYAVKTGGFSLALIGKSGLFKTTLARKYCLWMENSEEQEASFAIKGIRTSKIEEEIERLCGQHYLLDDLRSDTSRADKIRQSDRLDSIVRLVNFNSNCANVVLTGESLMDMGCFSCIDRILMVSVPKMSSERKSEIYDKIQKLKNGFMGNLAIHFAEVLTNHSVEVIEEIKIFLTQDSKEESSQKDLASRLEYYNRLLCLTERLFSRYCGIEETLGKLKLALSDQAKIQRAALYEISERENPPDYIETFYKIISSNTYLRVEVDPNGYSGGENVCLLHRQKIFITMSALKKAFFTFYKKYIPPSEVVKQLHTKGILEEAPNGKGRQQNRYGSKHYVVNLCFLISYLCENGCPVSEADQKAYLKTM